MCEALGRLGCRPTFLSAVGDDQNGHFLRSFLPRESLATVLVLPEHDTAQCTVVLDSKGDSKFLIGDMSIHGQITPEMVSFFFKEIENRGEYSNARDKYWV